jgi:hypothetical protein
MMRDSGRGKRKERIVRDGNGKVIRKRKGEGEGNGRKDKEERESARCLGK